MAPGEGQPGKLKGAWEEEELYVLSPFPLQSRPQFLSPHIHTRGRVASRPLASWAASAATWMIIKQVT